MPESVDIEGKGIFLIFISNLENLVNLAKSIPSSIYITLQAETLILICPPSFPLFSCQSFCPRRGRESPLKADSHVAVHRYEYDVQSMVLSS